MSKNNENKLVPKLRFPDYSNTGSWIVCDLIDTADKNIKWSFTGGPFGSNLKAEDYTEYGIRIIQLQNIGDGEFIDDYKIYASEEKANELLSCNIYSGEIILSKMGDPVGRACIIPKHIERCIMASDGIRLVVDENRFSKYFIYSLINSKQIREAIERKSTGSTRKRIGLDELKKIKLPNPLKLEEQQKIADCLSSLDEVITAESQKLEVLKDHKKGLLQNLLPQEGETVPKFRFKEFEDSGEWVEKKLGEVADFLKGKGISKADVDDKGKQPCIRYGELYTYYEEVIKEIKSFTNLNEKDLMLSEPNDVIIPSSGETKEDIATASCVKLGGVALGGDLNILRSSLNGDFLAYYLSHGLKKAISKIAQGDAVVHLYATQLKKLIIRVPLNKKEQEKIAFTLSSLDDLINAQNQKIAALKLHKKGLLQGLFPNVTEP